MLLDRRVENTIARPIFLDFPRRISLLCGYQFDPHIFFGSLTQQPKAQHKAS
jgi:hypothetical protein